MKTTPIMAANAAPYLFEDEDEGRKISQWEREGADRAHAELVAAARAFVTAAGSLRDYGVETVGPWTWCEALTPICDIADAAPCNEPDPEEDGAHAAREAMSEAVRIASKSYRAHVATHGPEIAAMKAQAAGVERVRLRSGQAQVRAIHLQAYAMTLATLAGGAKFYIPEDEK